MHTRKTPYIRGVFAVTACLCSSLAPTRNAGAQEKQVHVPTEPLPSAQVVFDKHRAAIGSVQTISSAMISGTITGSGTSAGTRFERYVDNSGRYLLQTFSGDITVSIEGWTGQKAIRMVKGKPVVLTPGRAAALREKGEAFLGLHTSNKTANATTKEWSDFNDRWHAKLEVSVVPGNVRTELYDMESGLLTAIIRDRGKDADGKRQDKMTVLRSYVLFDGTKFPTQIVELDGKSELRMKVESVRWNVPVPSVLR